jgi:hypothetical protein
MFIFMAFFNPAPSQSQAKLGSKWQIIKMEDKLNTLSEEFIRTAHTVMPITKKEAEQYAYWWTNEVRKLLEQKVEKIKKILGE